MGAQATSARHHLKALDCADDAACGTGARNAFPIGSVVRLVGMHNSEYNHHIGRVVTPLGNAGHVGVALHGAVVANAERDDEPIALSVENLRALRLPGTPAEPSQLGTVHKWALDRLLGEAGWGLPEAVAEQVCSYLRVHWVHAQDVTVSGCSSTRGDFPLQAVLGERRDEWWISAKGSMPGGVGEEYLEFSFGQRPRRISVVALRIPPLPRGPLSVRDFHLLALRPGLDPSSESSWIAASPNPLQTLDRADLQELAVVPPVETTAIRLVCTRNAVAGFQSKLYTGCVGLFQVSFA